MNFNYSGSGDAPSFEGSKTSATQYTPLENTNFSVSSNSEYNKVLVSNNTFDEQLQENVMKIIEEESYKTLLSPA